MRRIHCDFGTQFDVPEKDFAVRSGMRDMPPGVAYVASFKDAGRNLLIWRADGAFDQLKSAFPVFSEHVEGRDVRIPSGQRIGKDSWGYLKSGGRCRYVRFSSGDAVGYRPVQPREASMLDKVISSACRLPSRCSRVGRHFEVPGENQRLLPVHVILARLFRIGFCRPLEEFSCLPGIVT
jgi:hypothetical protein